MTTSVVVSTSVSEHGTVPATLVEAVQRATVATFSMICGEEPSYIGDGNDRPKYDGLVGIISFTGDVPWSLMLGLPRETAMALAVKFTGMEIDFDSPDMGDVVGELANILAGDATAQLDAVGVTVQMSVPTAARGSDLEMLLPGGLPSVRLNFSSPDGNFWVKVVTAKPT
ncbi:MAG: chemotaxis protein CheX [Abditibacteriales bacterium]|nr:chemotaxis protein CheX [Abditibacteriales bacterium]MDW8367392.1 chemotaxis protein CheX [Abditibacteriales bacterium]